MTKEQKVQEIQDLTERLSSVKNLYLTDIAGLDAVQTTALRTACILYTSPSPRDPKTSRMPSSA